MLQHPHLVHPKQHSYAVHRHQYQNSQQNFANTSKELPHRFHQSSREQMTSPNSAHLMHPHVSGLQPNMIAGGGAVDPLLRVNQYGSTQQKSFSSSEEELRYASEIDGEWPQIGLLLSFNTNLFNQQTKNFDR